MKKSVILLIAIVYIASIMIVGFYGMKIKIYDEKIMVEDIVFDNLTDYNGIDCSKSEKENYKKLYEQGIYYYIFLMPNEIPENGYVINVNFSVIPQTATIKDIEFIYSQPSDAENSSTSIEGNTSPQTKPKYKFVDNNNGSATITIYKTGSISFSVRPMDKASDIMKTIRIDIF